MIADKVGKSIRQQWRLKHINHQNPVVSNDSMGYHIRKSFIEQNFGSKKSFGLVCQRKTCKGKGIWGSGGSGASKYLTLSCDTCSNIVSDKSRKSANARYMREMKLAYAALCSDDGKDSVKPYLNAIGIGNISSTSLNSDFRYLFEIQNAHYKKIQEESHRAVREFMSRKGTVLCKDGKLPLTVSLDGSYPTRGHHSLYCVSFVFESYTGTCIDYIVTRNIEFTLFFL